MQLLAHDLPGTQILLLGLLPRGDREAPDPYAQPSKYTAALDQINAGYRCVCCRISLVYPKDLFSKALEAVNKEATEDNKDSCPHANKLRIVYYQSCPSRKPECACYLQADC